MDAPPDPPLLSLPQLLSFQVSYTSRSDYRNSLLPEGSKKGEWRHGILEVDFPIETFFLQDRDRILLSQTFSSFNKHADLGTSESCSLALNFNSDQWEIVAQNIAEKYCIQHLLDCIGKSIPVDDAIRSGKEKSIVGLDNSIIKHGKVQRKAVNQNRLDERYIILVPGKLFVFKNHNIKGKHVRYVTSVLGATVRMLPEEQEFQILAPGSKTMSLVPENQEEFHSWVEALGTSISQTKQAVKWLDSIRKEGEKKVERRSNNKSDCHGSLIDQNQCDGSKPSRRSAETKCSVDQDTSSQDSGRDILQIFSERKNTAETIKSPREVHYEAPLQRQGRIGLQKKEDKEIRRLDYPQCCRSKQSKAMMYLENALDEMENVVGNIKRVNIEKNRKSKASLTEKDLRWDREREKHIFNGNVIPSTESSISQISRNLPKSNECGSSFNLRHSINDISHIGGVEEMCESTKYGTSAHGDQINARQTTDVRNSFSGVGYSSPSRMSSSTKIPEILRNHQYGHSNEMKCFGLDSDRANTCALKPNSTKISANGPEAQASSSEEEDEEEEEELQENWRHSGGSMVNASRISSDGRKPLLSMYSNNNSLDKRSSIPSGKTLTNCYSPRSGSKLDQKGISAEGILSVNRSLESSDRYQSPPPPKTNPAQSSYLYNTSKASYDTPHEYKTAPAGFSSIDSECQPKTPRMTGNQPSNFVFHQSSSGLKAIPNPSEKRSFDYQRGLKEIPRTEFQEQKKLPSVTPDGFRTLHNPVYDLEISEPQVINRRHSSRNLQPERSVDQNSRNKDDYLDQQEALNTHRSLRNEPLPNVHAGENNVSYTVNGDLDMRNFGTDHRTTVGRQYTRQTFSSCSLEAWQHNQLLSGYEPELQLQQSATNKRDLQGYKEAKEEILANNHHSNTFQFDSCHGNDGSMSARGVNSDIWWSPSRPDIHGVGMVQGGAFRPDLGKSNYRQDQDEKRDSLWNVDCSMETGISNK